jgi:putative phosphoribosyl transferase
MTAIRFRDRHEAGQRLAARLLHYADRSDVLILALPRGGVPVAFEVGRALNAPMDVILVRKLGVPGQEELAMGAVASGGIHVLNPEVVGKLRIPLETVQAVLAAEQAQLMRRETTYRGDRPFPMVSGRIVILVDDGLATGASMRAAAAALRQRSPARMVVAAPVAAPETCRALQTEVDEVVCAMTPDPFHAVGLWYEDFAQTSDEEVRDLLVRSRLPADPPAT